MLEPRARGGSEKVLKNSKNKNMKKEGKEEDSSESGTATINFHPVGRYKSSPFRKNKAWLSLLFY